MIIVFGPNMSRTGRFKVNDQVFYFSCINDESLESAVTLYGTSWLEQQGASIKAIRGNSFPLSIEIEFYNHDWTFKLFDKENIYIGPCPVSFFISGKDLSPFLKMLARLDMNHRWTDILNGRCLG